MGISALLLLVGIVILIIAGDWMVRGAAALARHWGIPALIVGLTIVAFGTSAPELFVSIQAVLNGTSQLAAGNVIGSKYCQCAARPRRSGSDYGHSNQYGGGGT